MHSLFYSKYAMINTCKHKDAMIYINRIKQSKIGIINKGGRRVGKIRSIKKEIKGITLLSLVVTIIVLLILAGVAINFSIGDGGILKRAEDAA